MDETSSVLRGRIREADQLRRHWGRAIPLEIRYDEYSVDIAENQLLLAAAEQLLRLRGVGARLRTRLQRVRLQLADVSPPVRGQARPSWTPSRLNARYAPSLALAELILDGSSFETRVGEVVVTGYMFNMATVFEDFVTVGLREALASHGGVSRLQFRTHLDEAEAVPIRPDFVWLDRGVPRLVVDAKYKAEKPTGFPQADLYQLLAYCTVLGLPVGHLIYAKGNEAAQRHVVRQAGVQIITHTLDLESPPGELIGALTAMATSMLAASVDSE